MICSNFQYKCKQLNKLLIAIYWYKKVKDWELAPLAKEEKFH